MTNKTPVTGFTKSTHAIVLLEDIYYFVARTRKPPQKISFHTVCHDTQLGVSQLQSITPLYPPPPLSVVAYTLG